MMNLWSIVNIVLNLITLTNSICTIGICLFIFLLVGLFHRRSHSIPLLLACHACSILLVASLLLASMIISSISGFMGITIKHDGNTTWCRWRGFLIHASLAILYDSYMLQATYRFVRVVFYRRKLLHSYSLYCMIVIIESIFSLLSTSPILIRNHVIYLPSEYYCQTPFTDLPAIVYLAFRLFLLPIVFIALIYICLLRHIRQTSFKKSRPSQHRSKQNRRDLTVIKRLLLMLSFLILLGLPSVIFLIILLISKHLVPITYRVGWLSVSFSLVFLAYMLIQLTRPLRKTVRRVRRRV